MWPFDQLSAWNRVRSGAPDKLRPEPIADGSGPSWGPLSLAGADAMHRGDLFYVGLAVLVWWASWPDRGVASTWPTDFQAWRTDPVTAAATWAASWCGKVLARNLAMEIFIYEAWHQLLFGSLSNESIGMRRFHPKDPYLLGKNLSRERLACISGFTISSLYEIWAVHQWASATIAPCPAGGSAEFGATLLSGGCEMATEATGGLAGMAALPAIWFVLAFPLLIQMRGAHFFVVHRGMHPWWNRKNGLGSGDIGAFLYRHVHSFHHKSYNPGPWSSLSMHPIEHLLYFSLTFVIRVLPFHPIHLLAMKLHTDISALGGHDGHHEVGAGDVGHYLHHTKFECNYGFSFPNYLDRAFNTYDPGKSARGDNKAE